MELKVKIKLFFLLLIMSFNFANEPLLPPYHSFYVSGSVVCDSISNKSNYIIQLFGKSILTNNELMPVRSYRDQNRNSFTLTDSSGSYFLEVNCDIELDSIVVAVVLPQSKYIYSLTYYVDKEKRTEVTSTYSNNNGSGCNSCTSTVESQYTRVDRYIYNINNTEVNVCK